MTAKPITGADVIDSDPITPDEAKRQKFHRLSNTCKSENERDTFVKMAQFAISNGQDVVAVKKCAAQGIVGISLWVK